MTITGPGLKYVRTIWSPNGAFTLRSNANISLPPEEVIGIVGHPQGGWLITVCGTGPLPSDVNKEQPPIAISPPVEWPTPNTI
jgi:hypothetical protein